jgi:hypothetical protein
MYKVRTKAHSMVVLTWLLVNEIEIESADIVVENGVRVADEYAFDNPEDAIHFKMRWN